MGIVARRRPPNVDGDDGEDGDGDDDKDEWGLAPMPALLNAKMPRISLLRMGPSKCGSRCKEGSNCVSCREDEHLCGNLIRVVWRRPIPRRHSCSKNHTMAKLFGSCAMVHALTVDHFSSVWSWMQRATETWRALCIIDW